MGEHRRNDIGDILKADVFAAGDHIDVVGQPAKVRVTQVPLNVGMVTVCVRATVLGPVARHAGSMGSCSTPSRVFKGKKLPGHMGCERVTIQNLIVRKS